MRGTTWRALAVACFCGGCESGLSSITDGATDGGADFASVPDLAPPADQALCDPGPIGDPREPDRLACRFAAGARVADTLGLSEAARRCLPILNLVIVTEENRSFDHYLGALPASGRNDVDGWPTNYTNPDSINQSVAPFHLSSPCLPADPPHQWDGMHMQWDNGLMDGFVKTAAVDGGDGHYVMGYYDQTDIPFYYWLANTFAISDRYFAAALGGTAANRDYLYAATSNGIMSTGQGVIDVRTIFDQLTDLGVSFGVYSDRAPRQDVIGWTSAHAGVHPFAAFLAALQAGTLPSVAFVDPTGVADEHPPANLHGGEAWSRAIYEAARASPLWPRLAILYTYDEAGGLADHAPPPPACLPSPDQSAFDRLGFRVPLVMVSPWARPRFVSHRVHSHTSIVRLIQLLYDLPALTARDANSDALLDLFDFSAPPLLSPPDAPAAATGSCP